MSDPEDDRFERIKHDIWMEIRRAREYKDQLDADQTGSATYLDMLRQAVQDAWDQIEHWLVVLRDIQGAARRKALIEYFLWAMDVDEQEARRDLNDPRKNKEAIKRRIEEDQEARRHFEHWLN